jgi:hypothetical protein
MEFFYIVKGLTSNNIDTYNLSVMNNEIKQLRRSNNRADDHIWADTTSPLCVNFKQTGKRY